MNARSKVAKSKGLRYFSSLTPKQKDETEKYICSIISQNNPKFLHPSLWKMLFDVDFESIIKTQEEAEKYCKGYCFKYRGVWIPLKIKEYKPK